MKISRAHELLTMRVSFMRLLAGPRESAPNRQPDTLPPASLADVLR